MITRRDDPMISRRWLELTRVGWGLLLCVPGGAADRLTTDATTVRILRLAGLRQAVQGAVSALRPTARVLRWGGIIDLTHAASMVGAGLAMPTRRRLLLADSLVAGGWGLTGLRASRGSIGLAADLHWPAALAHR